MAQLLEGTCLQGKILVSYPDKDRVVVQNANMITKHVKPRRQGEPGGRIEKEGPIHVSNVKLEIRSGILYVSVYDGSTYKTTIEADDITVIKPAEDGQGGTVSTATIMRNQHPVMYFSRSYVQEMNMTKEEVEEKFGPVTRVEKAS